MKYFSNKSKPKIIVVGAVDLYTTIFDKLYVPDEKQLPDVLKDQIPDAIITINPDGWNDYKYILSLPAWMQRRWFHYSSVTEFSEAGLYKNIIDNQLSKRDRPKFSIFTPLYKSKYIEQAYESIKNQTLNDWEWILVDDSPSWWDVTSCAVRKMIEGDIRVKYIRYNEPTGGNIGLSKHRACSNCSGQYLIELDHDDIILSKTLEILDMAATEHPDSGMLYTDYTNIDVNRNPIWAMYGDSYAYGYAHPYRIDIAGQKDVAADQCPDINGDTIRHIVGVPNHLRCWKADVYNVVGGYDCCMRIADDYELCVKMFLATKFTRIPVPLYRQRFDGNNSQDASDNRADIQIRVRFIQEHYEERIRQRLKEFGVFQNEACNYTYNPPKEYII